MNNYVAFFSGLAVMAGVTYLVRMLPLVLVKKKIEKAQLLLITKDLAIKEIAYTLGYDNYSYFIKLFKKQTVLTPQTYKESNRKH